MSSGLLRDHLQAMVAPVSRLWVPSENTWEIELCQAGAMRDNRRYRAGAMRDNRRYRGGAMRDNRRYQGAAMRDNRWYRVGDKGIIDGTGSVPKG